MNSNPDKHDVEVRVAPGENTSNEDAQNLIENIRQSLAEFGIDVTTEQDGDVFTVTASLDASDALSGAVAWLMERASVALR